MLDSFKREFRFPVGQWACGVDEICRSEQLLERESFRRLQGMTYQQTRLSSLPSLFFFYGCPRLIVMRKSYSSPPPMTIDTSKKYTATLETSKGAIVVNLFAKEAPKTVNNFVFLAREGFYDGTKFHRVIENFMIQGGDPEGTGRGGPGYRFEDETRSNPHKHKVGSLSMANAGPDTNGSQFFITHVVADWLNGKHTVFGQVHSGQDVVNAVKQGDELKSVKIEES